MVYQLQCQVDHKHHWRVQLLHKQHLNQILFEEVEVLPILYLLMVHQLPL